MKNRLFVRNDRAAELLEAFFVSAVASLLLIRAFLYLTGYPEIGGNGLHIAHMLWGGLFMTAALVLTLASLGHRSLFAASILGGIGFGTFIDELGKFITDDNDYFYRPAAVLIYLVFIFLFFLIRALARHRPLTRKEALMNALVQLEEVIDHELDPAERERLQRLLAAAGPSPLTRKLGEVVRAVEASPAATPPLPVRLLALFRAIYLRIVSNPQAVRIVEAVFIIQALVSLGVTSFTLYARLATGEPVVGASYAVHFAELAASIVTTSLVIFGALRIWQSRLAAYELFYRALLLDVLLTEVLVFYREQFSAVFGLSVKISLLFALQLMMRAERGELARQRTAGSRKHTSFPFRLAGRFRRRA